MKKRMGRKAYLKKYLRNKKKCIKQNNVLADVEISFVCDKLLPINLGTMPCRITCQIKCWYIYNKYTIITMMSSIIPIIKKADISNLR